MAKSRKHHYGKRKPTKHSKRGSKHIQRVKHTQKQVGGRNIDIKNEIDEINKNLDRQKEKLSKYSGNKKKENHYKEKIFKLQKQKNDLESKNYTSQNKKNPTTRQSIYGEVKPITRKSNVKRITDMPTHETSTDLPFPVKGNTRTNKTRKAFRNLKNIPTKIFVFDFDQTFIPNHSGGMPFNRIKGTTGKFTDKTPKFQIDFNEYTDLLTQIKGTNNKIYINSRGLVGKPGEILQIRKFLLPLSELIPSENIRGATTYECIDDKESSTRDTLKGSMKTEHTPDAMEIYNRRNADEINYPGVLWEIKKSMILTDIMVENGVSKEQIYFFDDTEENITEAKENNGFINSFTVNINPLKKRIVPLKNTIDIYTGSGTELLKQIIDNIINKSS